MSDDEIPTSSDADDTTEALDEIEALEPTEPTEPKRSKLATLRTWAIDLAIGAVIAVIAVLGLNWWNDRDDETAIDTATTSFTLPSLPGSTTLPTATSTPPDLPDGCDATAPPQQGNGRQYPEPGDAALDPEASYTAVITTSCGDIEIELDLANAPISTNNFVFLAREGFFDGLTWHRAVTDFVIQGGDPDGTGAGGPGYDVVGEVPDSYETGTVAWAKASVDPAGTAGSQFFVTTGDPAALNATCQDGECDYGVIGTVVKGLENAQKIESLSPGDGAPLAPVYIVSVSIVEA